ncbi:MAG TPA: cytochrome D1 domain-containing protein [Thermoanaerobaculia bacterium]|nr:cytochrome D1 domain-containing protein [Thermoanaerobaculia bacterium]
MSTRMLRSALILGMGTLFAASSLQAATLVVANKAEATVSLVDLASGKVAATLPVGNGPHEVAISGDGRLALIANYGTGPQPGSTLTLIDVPAAKVVKTIDLGEYRRPHGVTFLGNDRALVTVEANKALLEVDIEGGKVIRAIETGQEVSHMVAVAPDGSRAFVANIGSGSVTAIDLKAGKKIADVQTGAGAEGIAITPDGRQVWVTNREADTVTVVDASTLKVVKTIEAASFPIRAEATPDGKRVLVSLAKSGDLAVFSTGGPALEQRLKLEAAAAGDQSGRLMTGFGNSSVPIGIEIAPDGKRAYVAHANADQISIVDLAQGKRTGFLTAGKEPDGMGMSPLGVSGQK